MNFRSVQLVSLTAVVALLIGIRVGGQAGSTRAANASNAAPPVSIPTFSTESLGRMAHFYVRGDYAGDPVFDNFIKGQMQFVNRQGELAVPAGVALLDRIGRPVILITHSQGGGFGFDVTEQRPKLVAGMVAIEPGGPQIGSVDTAKVSYTSINPNSWGLTASPYKYEP